MGENKRRDWISEKMDKAFKESLSEKDYQVVSNRQIMMRPDIKLPQPFASWSNSL